ncbi:delta-lactam-biosynthetic de-N-acetylase [Clostridium polynesiense]|uniref:delta-lactam-biosynthetic de-N-acetylase n=1 Tax=Clostridium polynesiense TaxID=1325933 RepID=UPI001FA6B7C8|nr:delta-lactam-biosynthetic de-N-acetylase [Clostridium polynesiense]
MVNKIQPAYNNNYQGLSTKELDWYYETQKNGEVPLPPKESRSFISKYNGYYVGDTSKKEIYLTFDEGYENGYTSKILDILKKHNIKAAFFVVKPYIKTNVELIKRMEEEGHLVCNHSSHHPSMAAITDKNKFQAEFTEVEGIYNEVTGKEMPKFFRPPMGKYSELSMKLTSDLGYRTIFWSFAYKDWIPESQPHKEYALNKILSRTHNGAIILLHAVSKTNAEILEELISAWKDRGYEIKSLNELP